MSIAGVGIDAVDIERFRIFVDQEDHPFITNTFSVYEKEYCFSFKDSAPHLAGMFAAKEAVVKSYGGQGIHVSNVEVRHTAEGAPFICRNGVPDQSIHISITHTDAVAMAIAVKHM